MSVRIEENEINCSHKDKKPGDISSQSPDKEPLPDPVLTNVSHLKFRN